MKTTLVLILLSLSSMAHSLEINSKKVNVNAARIVERIVLVDKPEKALHVQVIQEFLGGSTDLSNTGRVVFSISQLGEMSEATASFVISPSMSLISAKRISGGVYQVTYMDAREAGKVPFRSLEVTKTIDATKAVNDVLTACSEFESCDVNTTISVK